MILKVTEIVQQLLYVPCMCGGDFKKNDISNIITPEKANDIGERLILFPKHLNAQLDDNNVQQMLDLHGRVSSDKLEHLIFHMDNAMVTLFPYPLGSPPPMRGILL